ncbi:MAG: 7,8-didemethyl-8-hydroxy-5-deazariboflavin synthase subunit CofG [Candidatus Heimdallarchaeota archaeon]|nr:MAG: 7,8-didemethyl-8-hydroxy-5-deazariboflavin synthase subunit CofG [Candidatus Heimdallarchaeota archaeon]
MTSSPTITPSSSVTAHQALEFLRIDDPLTIEAWRRSAQIIATGGYQNQVTFTTNIFIPLTRLCRNACSYCGYSRPSVPKGKEYLSPNEIQKIFDVAKYNSVSEVLITMGEKPESKHPAARRWLSEYGFESTIEYTYNVAEKALNCGLLAHVNAGTLTFDELSYLRKVTASMGLMLETISSRLTQKGMPHSISPDKHPERRMRTIINAGKLKIPFTSGILIGIGETFEEIVESLLALKNAHSRYGHLQEVIIQNFRPHEESIMANSAPPSLDLMEKIIILARHILPIEISIQIPPNLINGNESRFIKAGISDWGGISSITPDYINPSHSWPQISQLADIIEKQGYFLCERLPVYPRYINLEWLSPRIYNLITARKLKTKDGFRRR